MPLNKQAVPINFSQGLDTKTDPKQVQMGKFLALSNSIFDKGGLLQKRNGFGPLTALPNTDSLFLTTFNGNLTAIGTELQAYAQGSSQWINRGTLQPLSLSTLPLIRSNTNQSYADATVAPNGMVCTVFTDNITSGSTTVPSYKYAVADSVTGQNIIQPTVITPTTGAVIGSPRVFVLGQHFVIVFTNDVGGTYHLQYIAISQGNPQPAGAEVNISSQYTPASTVAFDGLIVNNSLYLAWNGSDGGGAIRVTYIDSTLAQHNTVIVAGSSATMFSMAADGTTAIYISFYTSSGTTAKVMAITANLLVLLAPTTISTANTILNLASFAVPGSVNIYYEVANSYTYDSTIPTNYIATKNVTQSGTVSSQSVVVRSLGLASKAFSVGGLIYMMGTYSSQDQPSYFLINSSGQVVAKLAYENGGGYQTTGLPSVTVSGSTASIAYLYKDLIGAVNKSLGITNFNGVYSQTGVNLVNLDFVPTQIVSSEIGNNLNISGGLVYSYDGYSATEQGFNLYPDNVKATPSSTGGGLLAQQYYYQATYDWTDNQGNAFRSSPSIPVSVTIPPLSIVSFTSVFSSGDQEITVSSATGLYVGQTITDVTSPSNLADGTTITAISGTTVTLSTPAVGDSALTPGDTLNAPAATSFTSVFSSGVSSIVVSSATGLYVGQIINDVTSATNIPAGTYITSITGTTIGLSQPTARASASSPGDTLITTQSGSAVIDVPTLRLTYKTANPVKIVIYRWSVAQQVFYQVTSILVPLMNNTTIDSVSFTDTQADYTIQGNNILYTTGGVLENVGPPSTSITTLFDDRLWLVDAEDNNLLWFSKQVIEATPVEMSDLLTVYVAPTIGVTGSTGGITALGAMDDKLIIFKKEAIYYINGTGPDNTGSNSQYSPSTFVNATVGCSNPNSIVFQPAGLMFQSDKGIWLLGRDLSSNYIGAPVQALTTGATVLSAISIPGTNQIRFTLDSGITLMYDYYYGQWGTFINIPAASSTLYQGLHTYLNDAGLVYQETPGAYLDDSNPVLMSFTTSWINLAGLQGFQRAYYLYIIASYLSPHKLSVQIAYDYNPSSTQQTIITPDNYSNNYGVDSVYGGASPYGGIGGLEQWKLFFQQQKCEAFQLTITEIFDPQFGTIPGAGFTMSGMDLVIGGKSGYPRIRPTRNVG